VARDLAVGRSGWGTVLRAGLSHSRTGLISAYGIHQPYAKKRTASG